jgi:hypothetical protein
MPFKQVSNKVVKHKRKRMTDMNKTIDDQIRALRTEAGAAGDGEMVAICDRALSKRIGAHAAREVCARVIAEASPVGGAVGACNVAKKTTRKVPWAKNDGGNAEDGPYPHSERGVAIATHRKRVVSTGFWGDKKRTVTIRTLYYAGIVRTGRRTWHVWCHSQVAGKMLWERTVPTMREAMDAGAAFINRRFPNGTFTTSY